MPIEFKIDEQHSVRFCLSQTIDKPETRNLMITLIEHSRLKYDTHYWVNMKAEQVKDLRTYLAILDQDDEPETRPERMLKP